MGEIEDGSAELIDPEESLLESEGGRVVMGER